MFIPLPQLIAKYNLGGKIKGIIHVGAHFGEEAADYQACGIHKIVWVEPCRQALGKLHEKFSSQESTVIMGCAFGEKMGTTEMYVANENLGASNSILAPDKHLQQFPSIVFNERETIMVFPMDTFAFLQVGWYNFLNMDVQGYEDRVLKGGHNTLKSIDYVYTEVNRAEVYANCAKVDQMDLLLADFDRVETKWCDGGEAGDWGDAFYIRKTKR